MLVLIWSIAGCAIFFGFTEFFSRFAGGVVSPWWTWPFGSLLFASVVRELVLPGERKLDVDLRRSVDACGLTFATAARICGALFVLGGWLVVSYSVIYYWYPPRPFGLWRLMLLPLRGPLLPIGDPGYGPYQESLLWMSGAGLFLLHQMVRRLLHPGGN
jgi:hypothetical protein